MYLRLSQIQNKLNTSDNLNQQLELDERNVYKMTMTKSRLARTLQQNKMINFKSSK